MVTSTYNNFIHVLFTRLTEDDITYIIKLTSNELGITDKCFTSDDGTWHLISENKKQQYTFDVSVHMEMAPCASSFASLHEDTELTDFELRGADGSVRMHRAVMAAASPVLRRMLIGPWRAAAKGLVELPATSRVSLQHLKNYMYLQTVPDSGLEELLLLSSYYMMPNLTQKCVDKLVSSVSAATACEMIGFAASHQVTRLMVAILECVQSGGVSIADMRTHLLQKEKNSV